MKRFLLSIILLSSIYTLNSFAQTYGWYVIDPPSIPGIVDFSDLYFTDDNTGWLTTSTYDSIYRTDDGAITFSTQSTPLDIPVLSICWMQIMVTQVERGDGYIIQQMEDLIGIL